MSATWLKYHVAKPTQRDIMLQRELSAAKVVRFFYTTKGG